MQFILGKILFSHFKKANIFDEEKRRWQTLLARSGNSESGFTLIEVLIALVILGIALIPLLVAQAKAVGDYGYANNATYETVLAKNIMPNVFLPNEIYK